MPKPKKYNGQTSVSFTKQAETHIIKNALREHISIPEVIRQYCDKCIREGFEAKKNTDATQ